MAHGRVYDINRESFAAYFRGNYSPSVIKKSAFENASGAGETFDAEAKDNFGGEFGFVYTSRSFQHIGILSLEFHVDKLSRPLL